MKEDYEGRKALVCFGSIHLGSVRLFKSQDSVWLSKNFVYRIIKALSDLKEHCQVTLAIEKMKHLEALYYRVDAIVTLVCVLST